jgi:hypothetical protein
LIFAKITAQASSAQQVFHTPWQIPDKQQIFHDKQASIFKHLGKTVLQRHQNNA